MAQVEVDDYCMTANFVRWWLQLTFTESTIYKCLVLQDGPPWQNRPSERTKIIQYV